MILNAIAYTQADPPACQTDAQLVLRQSPGLLRQHLLQVRTDHADLIRQKSPVVLSDGLQCFLHGLTIGLGDKLKQVDAAPEEARQVDALTA